MSGKKFQSFLLGSTVCVQFCFELCSSRLNGVDPEDFPALKYAKLWKQNGNLLTDDPSQQRRPKQQATAPDDATDAVEDSALNIVGDEEDPRDYGDKIIGNRYLDHSLLF